MALTERDRKLLIMVVALLMVVGYWFVLMKPSRTEVADLSAQITSKEQMLKDAQAQLQSVDAAKSSYQTDYGEVVSLGQAVPEDDAISDLLVQLDSLSGEKIQFTQIGIERYPDALLSPSLKGVFSDSSATEPQTATPAAGAAPASSSGAATAASGSSASAAPQPEAQSSIPFQPIEIRLQFQGNFFHLHKLFSRLDQLVQVNAGKVTVGGRLIFIEGFKISEGREGFPSVSVSVGAMVFSLPEDQSVTNGATAQAPSTEPPSQPAATAQKAGATPTAAATGVSP